MNKFSSIILFIFFVSTTNAQEYVNEDSLLIQLEKAANEKNKIDIKLEFKQYEFDKDVPVSLTVPKNYKVK